MPTTYIIERGAELVCDGECLTVHKDEALLQSLPLIKLGSPSEAANALDKLC